MALLPPAVEEVYSGPALHLRRQEEVCFLVPAAFPRAVKPGCLGLPLAAALPTAVSPDYWVLVLCLHHREMVPLEEGLPVLRFPHQSCSEEASLVAHQQPAALPAAVGLGYLKPAVRLHHRAGACLVALWPVEASLVAVEPPAALPPIAEPDCSVPVVCPHHREEDSSVVLQPGQPQEVSLVVRWLLAALPPVVESGYLAEAFLGVLQLSRLELEGGSLVAAPALAVPVVAYLEVQRRRSTLWDCSRHLLQAQAEDVSLVLRLLIPGKLSLTVLAND